MYINFKAVQNFSQHKVWLTTTFSVVRFREKDEKYIFISYIEHAGMLPKIMEWSVKEIIKELEHNKAILCLILVNTLLSCHI